jgi:hypothetical protein
MESVHASCEAPGRRRPRSYLMGLLAIKDLNVDGVEL